MAIDGLRVTAGNYDAVMARYRVGDALRVHVFRRDELLELKVKLTADAAPQITLVLIGNTSEVRLRNAWLGR